MTNSAADTPHPSMREGDPDEAFKLDPGHGNTVAGWTAIITMFVGVIVVAIGFFLLTTSVETFYTMFAIGAAIVLLGLIAGGILKLAGFGVGGHRTRRHS